LIDDFISFFDISLASIFSLSPLSQPDIDTFDISSLLSSSFHRHFAFRFRAIRLSALSAMPSDFTTLSVFFAFSFTAFDTSFPPDFIFLFASRQLSTPPILMPIFDCHFADIFISSPPLRRHLILPIFHAGADAVSFRALR